MYISYKNKIYENISDLQLLSTNIRSSNVIQRYPLTHDMKFLSFVLFITLGSAMLFFSSKFCR